MRRAPLLLIVGGVFVLGFLMGPLAAVAITSMKVGDSQVLQLDPAYHLLSAFDDRYPEGIRMAQMDFDRVARDCGYTEELYGRDLTPRLEDQRWTPAAGYLDLTGWLDDEFFQEAKRRRAGQLRQNFTDYELKFLDGCMRKTVFANLCGEQVRRILREGNLLSPSSLNSPFPQPRRIETICTYLDGIAARKKQPLARRSS
jgi:hypothetical protein